MILIKQVYDFHGPNVTFVNNLNANQFVVVNNLATPAKVTDSQFG